MQQDHQSVGWQKGTLMLEGVVDSKWFQWCLGREALKLGMVGSFQK